ncbi:hypothetical protein NP233_g2505 [Leucocoprinus birnbaumii]|uniref:Methyltransferase type 11 domain-containing protein n=1 Tax=Leucocoprinus birnbaumii TaxID=56174 RepID=A0AAD5W4F3_9AGAR|nr:hypothetical protein NP233_g2505 [Leucocoprinus birnbaumii]
MSHSQTTQDNTPQHHHHHHVIHHGHAHGHHHDSVAQANKEYFDDLDADFDKIPHVKDRAVRVVQAILKAYPLDKENTTAMDFACGRVSLEMVPYVKSILGVDISERMVARFNENLSGTNASATCIELKGEEGELSGAKFDIIFCSSAYHHFASVDGVTRILASFLNPGGALIIADMIHKEEGYEFMANVGHAVPHKHGLSKTDIQRAFDGAGLSLKSFEDIPEPTDYNDVQLFLAVGEKTSS